MLFCSFRPSSPADILHNVDPTTDLSSWTAGDECWEVAEREVGVWGRHQEFVNDVSCVYISGSQQGRSQGVRDI